MNPDPVQREQDNERPEPNHVSRILVFTATYNEADNIVEWLARVRRSVPEADILIVDDGSPDGTGQLIRDFEGGSPRIRLVERPSKAGLGSAHKLAFEAALQGGYDVLVTMDADLSHEPEEAPALIRGLEGADFVIGSRWGEGTCEYSGVRKAVSWMGNWAARILLRAPVSEYTTSFRAFSPRALAVVTQAPPEDDGYAFFMEVVIDLHRAGVSMGEVPITFRDRADGESKIPKGQILVSSVRLLEKAVKRRER